MKITRIKVYQVDLPLHEGSYKWSGGKSVEVFDSTVVAIETDAGITGHGEVCPLGPFYLPAFAAGARAGLRAQCGTWPPSPAAFLNVLWQCSHTGSGACGGSSAKRGSGTAV